jgi:hypothetical protein
MREADDRSRSASLVWSRVFRNLPGPGPKRGYTTPCSSVNERTARPSSEGVGCPGRSQDGLKAGKNRREILAALNPENGNGRQGGPGPRP